MGETGVPLEAAVPQEDTVLIGDAEVPLATAVPQDEAMLMEDNAAAPQEDTIIMEDTGVPLAAVVPQEDTILTEDTGVPLAAAVPQDEAVLTEDIGVPLAATVPQEDTMFMGDTGVPLAAVIPQEDTMLTEDTGVPLAAAVPQGDTMPQDVMSIGDSGVPLAAAGPVEDSGVPPADGGPQDAIILMGDSGVPLADSGLQNGEAMVPFEPSGFGDLTASVDENAIPDVPSGSSDPAIPSVAFEAVPEEPVFPDPPPFPVDDEPVDQEPSIAVEDMAGFMPFEPIRDEVPLIPEGDSMAGPMSDGMGMETLEPTETPVAEAGDPAIIFDSTGFGDVLPPSGGSDDASQDGVFEDTFIPFMPEEMFSKLPQVDEMVPDREPMSDAEVFVPDPPAEELEAMMPSGPALIEVQEHASLPPSAAQDMAQLPEVIADDDREGQVFQETPPTVEPAIPPEDLEAFFVAEDPEAGDTPTAIQGQDVVLEVAQQLPEDQFDIAPLDGIAPFMAEGGDVGTLQEEFEAGVLLFPDEEEEEEEEEEEDGAIVDTFVMGDFG
ncbi:proline-, glutamic acid- and leucine-rich protein 1-like [Penaeus monodon]|uniref:proline-, glutamic acid- and leucine-rich protein 1-like n=1 Tax=Penaeus monodon TaxID=6687 RepID=UPI0018A785EB|nr:proline-, glutamic acid- and leucine-rich protein 1-like [Penaeus monodon]